MTEKSKRQIAAETKERLVIEDNYIPLVHDDKYILEVNALKKYFPIKDGLLQRVTGHIKAVDGISFKIERGTTMGLVGESGCGKTTAGRTILRLTEKSAGQVLFNGKEVYDYTKKELQAIRPQMQIIFQDPFSSLSPRLPIREIIGEAVREHEIVPRNEFNDYINDIMENCGLQPYHRDRYPHEFSGGQRQRICIARALALNPDFVVCDEPVSALDVSVQAQIINLLMDLQDKFKLTYLFISHDLSVVEHISDTIGVMYLGDLVEFGRKEDIFRMPLHPYTKALFSAIPVPDPTAKINRILIEGSMPSPANPPKGCKFHTRCQSCMEMCKTVVPVQKEIEPGHYVVCHLYNDYEGA
ncbi:MAG: ATP-binding cassette domain-containing protein [Clostridia bacterium]|nr:ATP-binding cassette domain-containing protein [Clostridia bacterium]